MSDSNFSPDTGMETRTSFVRHRNVLMARADLGHLYVDYYLHLADQQIQIEPEHDRMFKDALAAFTLHCASRPRNELIAWTINFQEPLLNLFLVGDNELGTVAGRVFTDNIKVNDENLFFADVVRSGQKEPRRSAVAFQGRDPFGAVEHFYEQSEQRPARYFRLKDEEFMMLSAHPDYDMEWLRGLESQEVRDLEDEETLVPMESRTYRWSCGCSHDRILEVLAPTMRLAPEELFQGEEMLGIGCPRCGTRYNVTREALEAYVARDNEEK